MQCFQGEWGHELLGTSSKRRGMMDDENGISYQKMTSPPPTKEEFEVALNGSFQGEFVETEPHEDTRIEDYGFEAPPALDPYNQFNDDLYERQFACPEDQAAAIAEMAHVREYGGTSPGYEDGTIATSSKYETELMSRGAAEALEREPLPPVQPAPDYTNTADAPRESLSVVSEAEIAEKARLAGMAADIVATARMVTPTPEELQVAAVAAAELKEAMGVGNSDENSALSSSLSTKEKRKQKKKKQGNKGVPILGSDDEGANAAVISSLESAGCRNIEKAKRKPGASKRLNRPSNVNQQSGAFGGQLPVDTPVLAAESESDLDTSWKSPSGVEDLTPNDVLLMHNCTLFAVRDAIGVQSRIKYTCAAVSDNFIALGANTGGVYVFTKRETRFLQVISTGTGLITALAFAPDDELLAVGSNVGGLSLWTAPWANPKIQVRLIKQVTEHTGISLTALKWHRDSKGVVSGDARGLVLLSPVTKKAMLPSATSLFPRMSGLHRVVNGLLPYSEVVYRCGASITQLDISQDGLVLISTFSKVYVANSAKREVWEVGSKPRTGQFGACWGKLRHDNEQRILTARPGARIWIAKVTGKVEATVNLRQQFDRESTPMVRLSGDVIAAEPSPGAIGYQLSKLKLVRERYLAAWTSETIFIIDPSRARLTGWFADINGIIDVAVQGNDLYILYAKKADRVAGSSVGDVGFLMDHISLLSPGETATALSENARAMAAAELLLEYYENASEDEFLEHVGPSTLTYTRHQLAKLGENSEIVDKFTRMVIRNAEQRAERENLEIQRADENFNRAKAFMNEKSELQLLEPEAVKQWSQVEADAATNAEVKLI